LRKLGLVLQIDDETLEKGIRRSTKCRCLCTSSFRCLDNLLNESKGLVEIFFSSRRENWIRYWLDGCQTIEVTQTKTRLDLELYIETEVKRRGTTVFDEKLKNEVKVQLKDRARGE
jgi:hypothetical protein